jgi:signal transduction histidine kinase/FixJ family two-component response regulator/HPt (histidine-containing phosphotransfer) domain-containing protein
MFIIALSGCGKTAEKHQEKPASYNSFRELPHITEDEIKAIETLRGRKASFIYGTTPNTEAFDAKDGSIQGYTTLLCEWLTKFFDIPFVPTIYTWGELIRGLEAGSVDFTGELTATEERRKVWFMTDAIAERSIKVFRIQNSLPLSEIMHSRPIRYGFLEGTTTVNAAISAFAPGTFETIFINDSYLAYDLLKNGSLDAFINEGPGEIIFDVYSDVSASDLFPPVYEPVSLSTRNPELRPIISVVQKMLENGGIRYLTELYNQGYRDYLKHKLLMRLDDDELKYIQNNPVIPFLAEHDNYPISFYNTSEKAWQGIAFDVIDKIETLTGLSFNIVNDQNTEWSDLLKMFEDGKAPMITELIREGSRDGRFIWPHHAIVTDQYALVSKSDYRNININEILFVKVGLMRDTAYASLFKKWFPGHLNTTEYESMDAAFQALARGEVNMIMSSLKQLLVLTNYREFAGYKANIIFSSTFDSTFGFTKDASTLCYIVDKAIALVDTGGISGQWMRKTYDYREKLVRSRFPWLIGASTLLLCVLTLLFALFLRNRNEGKRLENLVLRRTAEADAASKAKSKFLASMSHEMRTPLNAIIGLSEIELGTSNLAEESFINMEKIYTAGMSLLGIINDLLDISKIESGKFTLIPIVYDVPSMINDTISLNIVRIGSKPIDFHLHVDGSLPSRLEGDELRIKQIFSNLLSNAIKYTDSGAIDWTISTVQEGTRVKIISTIKDTGKGIKDEDLKKLFQEDYFQTDLKANYYVEGTGLGLPITYNMVKLMGGSISIESEFRKGSVFTVEFYQKAAGEQVIGEEAAANLTNFRYSAQRRSRNQKIIRPDMSYATVLVVDDVVTNLDVARSMLKLYKLNVDCVTSGQEAVNRIREEKTRYNAVFMDHMMPGMDGIEATRIIREEIDSEYAKNIPIIALTANALIGNDEMFMGKGFHSFLSKPIDVLRLDQILHQWVRDKIKEKELPAPQHETTPSVKEVEKTNTGGGSATQLLSELENLGINVSPALARFNNDMESYLQILSSYAKHTPTFISNARNFDDLEWYRIAVHSIKGSSRGIGADELGNLAEKMEQAVKQGDAAFIEANNGSFIEATEKFVDSVSAFLRTLPNEQNSTATHKKAGI